MGVVFLFFLLVSLEVYFGLIVCIGVSFLLTHRPLRSFLIVLLIKFMCAS